MNIRHHYRGGCRRALLLARSSLPALGLALLSALPGRADLRQLPLRTKDLIYDSARQRIYASIPPDGGDRANSVTMIDPETGALGPSIPVGPDPGKLALSGDGRYLYVGLDGANAVRRVDLQSQNPDLQFTVKIGQSPPYVVDDMQVVPGSPHSVAVVLGMPGISPRFAGLVIYDEGVPRPKKLDPFAGTTNFLDYASRIQFGPSPTTLYGLNEESGSAVTRIAVDASGVTVTGHLVLPAGSGGEFRFSQGQLYLSSGGIVDPQVLRLAGSFDQIPPPSVVLPDPASGRVFFLSAAAVFSGGPLKLLAYDQQTRQQAGSVDLPLPLNSVTSLIAWGRDGLAFRTDKDQVVLLRTSLRTPGVHSADLAITGTVGPNPVRVGDPLTLQLSISNMGPDPEPDAVLSSPLPSGVRFVSATTTQGHCTLSGSTVICDLGGLESGQRATATLAVQPMAPGLLALTSTLTGQTTDPYSGNNATTQRVTVASPVPAPPGSGATGLPVYALQMQPISLPARDLVYDRVSRRIYASVPSAAGAIGNSVVPIDPLTGAVGTPIGAGSEPGKLALSGDGHYLYVGLDGAAAVRRVDLRAQTAGLQFSPGIDPLRGPLFAGDLAVLPGSPESVAILRSSYPGSGGDEGIAIYDNGTPRVKIAGTHFFNSTVLQFSSSPERLYAYNGETTEYGFRRLEVDDQGVAILDVVSSLITGSSVDMKYDQGLMFTSNGPVIDPESRLLLGSVAGLDDRTLVAPDAAAGQIFYLTGQGSSRQLRVVSSTTLLPREALTIPMVKGRAGSLIRWGQEQTDSLGGLAFLTDTGQVFLARLVLVNPIDLAFTLSPEAAIGGGVIQGMVTLTRPAPPEGAQVLLSSAGSAIVSPPFGVTVPAGATRATFRIVTRPVDVPAAVELTASYAGVDRMATLKVQPLLPPIGAFSISPPFVPGGTSAVGTVQLAGPAPAGGRDVSLSADSTLVGAPPHVKVPAGATTASFSIATHPVTDAALVTFSAVAGQIRGARLWVLPVGLTLMPTAGHAGGSVTAALVLPQLAPAGGGIISITGSAPAVVPVPAQVTVPAGQRTASFVLQAQPVSASTLVRITATYHGAGWRRSLTVLP